MRFASRLLRGNSYSFSHINLCTSLTYGNSYCIEPTTPTPTATYLNKKNESCIEPTTAPYVLRLLRLRKLLFMIFLIQLSCWTPIGKKQLLRFRVSHETENSHSDYHRYTELRRYEIYLAWGGRPTNLKREFLLNRVFSVFDASTHYAVNPAGQSSRADSDASDTGWLWGKRKRSDPQLILRIVIALGASHEQILIVKNDHTYSIPISVPSRKNSHKIQSGGFIRRTLKRRTIHYQGLLWASTAVPLSSSDPTPRNILCAFKERSRKNKGLEQPCTHQISLILRAIFFAPSSPEDYPYFAQILYILIPHIKRRRPKEYCGGIGFLLTIG